MHRVKAPGRIAKFLQIFAGQGGAHVKITRHHAGAMQDGGNSTDRDKLDAGFAKPLLGRYTRTM
jgi:hypothetical protein